jgi:hypothetical protein
MIEKGKVREWQAAVARGTNGLAARADVAEAVAAALHKKVVATPSWDPYDVWLKRVQEPRQRRRPALRTRKAAS